MLPICRHVPLLREAAAYLDGQLGKAGYETLRDQFIGNGADSRWGKDVRRRIVEAFAGIHDNVETHTTPVDSLVLAEAALSLDADGDMVECGCFKGGSTATLSILAKILGKRLLVFDSFEGLPEIQAAERVDHQCRSARSCTWLPGANRGSLDEVAGNVRRFGAIEVCVFHKGWFADTLTPGNLPGQICLAFTDVVLASSVRDCLRALWPRLAAGGVYFSRDVALTKALQSMLAPSLWRDLNETPPILFGGGYGLNDASPHLGYFVKGDEMTPEYLDRLRLHKPARSSR
jgi:O-methyltransferase